MNTTRTTHKTPRIRTLLATSALGLGLLSACGEDPAPTGQATVSPPTEAPATTVAIGPVSADAAERWSENDAAEHSIGPVNPDAAERWAANDGTDDLQR